ncbi:Putative outer membrane protein [Helicobacter suis HS1]|nr:Putative outer membrane protein [Helicobacter suis HS1]
MLRTCIPQLWKILIFPSSAIGLLQPPITFSFSPLLARLWGVLVLLFMGIGVGVVIFTGACVAPVIFKTSSILPTPLTRYDAGILMSHIFIRSNWVLNALACILVLDSLILKKAILLRLSHLASSVLIFLFSFYYTPFILRAQSLGSVYTTSEKFIQMHAQSEIIFKILLTLLCFSFVSRALRNMPKTSH